jgi:DNA polymerase elongation subunit (family B)
MQFYTNVLQYGNKILIRGINNGKKEQNKVEFSPKLFVKTNNQSSYKSIYGENLESLEFESINAAKDFIKKYKDVNNFGIFGNTNFTYQYITEHFAKDIDFDITKIDIWSLDIECSAEYGFPNVNDPLETILLITVQNYSTKKIITFGINNFDVTKENHVYIECLDEYDLLKKFISFICNNTPHIITGWNIEFFDIPYLCNRILKILGEDALKQLSPWGTVNKREISRFKKIETIFDIMGIAILDYLDLYKKFTYNAQESYRLDHIAKVELGKEKLDYSEYDSFRMFYKNNWSKFVKYNVIDTELIDQLEDKMKLIELIVTMAYDAKCNYVDIFSPVRTWDCILYNHLWKKKIIVHQRNEEIKDRQIEGAYVHEPVPGKYDWVVSFDATSLYPSIIMQYNLSPETKVIGRQKNITVDSLISKSINTSDYVQEDICMTANGYFFKRNKQGIFPEIVNKLFNDRLKYKKLMLDYQKKYETTKNKDYLKNISKYNNFQMARKIQLNSLFGAWSNAFFRFVDFDIAEGITITGQYIIRTVGKALDEYLNKICGTTNQTYSFYYDTDACYITLDNLVKKYYNNMPSDEIVKLLDKICKEKIEKIITKTCNEIISYTNAFEPRVFFKREIIAQRGIWVAKKRYALNVFNNEGVQYTEPRLKVMGLEVVRSSTPEAVREALRQAVKLALTKTELHLQKYVKDFEKEFKKLKPEDIAFPRSVNGVEKYKDNSLIYRHGTPIHVRGSLLYNFHLRKNKLDKKYELIQEGDKIKFLYLKEPNIIGENCIAFISSIPEELNIKNYTDYDIMFEKSFLEPINSILNCIGWSSKPKATLEGLFI